MRQLKSIEQDTIDDCGDPLLMRAEMSDSEADPRSEAVEGEGGLSAIRVHGD